MNFVSTVIDTAQYINLQGRLDGVAAPISAEANQETGFQSLVLSFSECTYVPSIGISALLRACKVIILNGGSTEIVNLTPALLEDLNITG